MFSTRIGREAKYDFNEPKFKVAFEFLKRKDLKNLPEGWTELGHGVRAGVQHYTTAPRKEQVFETHDKHFDVQYLIEGTEIIGVVDRSLLKAKGPYDKADDCTLYEDPAAFGEVLLNEGDFVIVAPEDAHKPRCAASKPMAVKKVVVKIPV
ncbi:MAG: YhcH/YjgK/YiaL family protein [Sphaerochaetaceae bacterium]|jgi:biofilm protein TabA